MTIYIMIFAWIIATLAILVNFLDKWRDYNSTNDKSKKLILYFSSGIAFLAASFTFVGGCNADQSAISAKAQQQLNDSLNRVALADIISKRKDELDSAITKTSVENLKEFTAVLAQYNLSYNAEQKKVQSLIRDSMNREMPSLDVNWPNSGSIGKDTIGFDLHFVNSGNCPLKVNVAIYMQDFFRITGLSPVHR